MVNTIKNFLISLKNLQQLQLKLLQKAIQKTAEATGDLIGYKIAKMAKVSKNSQQNNSETVTNEHDKEIPKERYTSSKKKDKELLII